MRFLALLFPLALVGCGGGGSSDPARPAVVVCTPAFVTIALYGDSTQAGFDGSALVLKTPTILLQEDLDSRFGRGSTLVVNHGVGSTTALDLIRGDGVNQPWPKGVQADLVVDNHGINDATNYADVTVYKAALRTIAMSSPVPLIFETPNQVHGADTGLYAQAMREVAQEFGLPVADVNPYLSLGLLSDWAHPSQEGYDLLVKNILAPVVAAKVAPLRCV